jgi:TonB family protein
MRLDSQLLKDPWVMGMLPESDRPAGLASLCSGMMSFALGFVFQRLQTTATPEIFSKSSSVEQVLVMDLKSLQKPSKVPSKPIKDPVEKTSQNKSKTDAKSKPSQHQASSGGSGGGAKAAPPSKDLKSPKRGVLKLLASANVKDLYTAYTSKALVADLDKILNQVNSVRKSGRAEFGGRRSAVSGNYGDAFNPNGSGGDGFGGGVGGGLQGGRGHGIGGGIGDQIQSLRSAGSGYVAPSKSSFVQLPKAESLDWADDGAGRSKSDIMRVVRSRISGLRYLYTRYLKGGEAVSAASKTLILRLQISASGQVLQIECLNSQTDSPDFDGEILAKIKTWDFGAAPSAGITTVTIPFVFSE